LPLLPYGLIAAITGCRGQRYTLGCGKLLPPAGCPSMLLGAWQGANPKGPVQTGKGVIMGKAFIVTGSTLTYTKGKAGSPKDGVKYGKRTGLPLTAYVCELLEGNRKAKADDGVLMAELMAEFAGRPAVQSIAAYRNYFNQGKHGFNPTGKPHVESYGRNTNPDLKPRKDGNHPNAKPLDPKAAKARQAAKAKAAKAAAKGGKGGKGKGGKAAPKAAKPKAAKAVQAAS
jgi:hypothetical protein